MPQARDSDRTSAALQADARFRAIHTRDANADDTFFYSVATTGVYCRPSCGARRARPEHVRFHESAEAAARAGFRPCKRCRPDEPPPAERRAAEVAALCRLIEDSVELPTLDALAAHTGTSPGHVQRMFKSVTGVTPRAYAAAHRASRARGELTRQRTVTDALYGAGYGSSGRFYAQSTARLGMTPSQFRGGGAGDEIRFAVGRCSLGAILVAATVRGICAISLGDEPEPLVRELEARFPHARLLGADAEFERQVALVVGLVDDPKLGTRLPLDIRGTAFQERVWSALSAVPVGTTLSYTELAKLVGAPRAVRAVARACADNPLAVAIPCHRVVRLDGSSSGYRWGIERKRALQTRERS